MCLSIFSLCAVIYKSQQPLLCLPLLSGKWWSMQLLKSQKMTCRMRRWVRCVHIQYCTAHKIAQWCLNITIITSSVCLCVTQGEKIIFEYFSDPEFIGQLIEFLSLEDRKGKDSFNPRCYCLFKVQFKLSASIDLANLLQRSDTAYHLKPRLNWAPQNWNLCHQLLWFIVFRQTADTTLASNELL